MKKRVLSVILCAVLTMAMMGCSTKAEEPAQEGCGKGRSSGRKPDRRRCRECKGRWRG